MGHRLSEVRLEPERRAARQRNGRRPATSGRDIVFSLSNTRRSRTAAELARLANCWRTTGDIRDNWGASAHRLPPGPLAAYAGPGHWNDPDMLVVGYVGWGTAAASDAISRRTSNTRTSASGACLASPLLLGYDLERLDDVHAQPVDQRRSAGRQSGPARQAGDPRVTRRAGDYDRAAGSIRPAGTGRKHMARQVWARELADGSRAVGLFNLSDEPATVTVKWSDIGVNGKQVVRDLWRQQDVGTFEEKYETTVAPHGVFLAKVSAEP